VPPGTHGAHAAAASAGNRQLGKTRARHGRQQQRHLESMASAERLGAGLGDGDMLATTPSSLTTSQVGRATSGLVSASTSTAPTAGSSHRARTERYSSSANNRLRFAQDGNVNVNTRLIRGFGPFSTCATTKSLPKAPRWRARIGAIALRFCA